MPHPLIGGVYQIDTVLLSGQDPKPYRPAVVIALPRHGLPDVQVLTRTSDLSARGVPHPTTPSLGLTKPGVFAFQFLRSLDVQYFAVPKLVEYRGQLEPPYFEKILAWWEEL